jgi:5-methylcytosine-specific restriction endonuclease McrA
VTPLSSQSYAVQFTMDQEAYALLREAQELLGHQVASGDVAAVMKRALQALVPRLRKQKFAATDRPRPGPRRATAGKRHIPAHVRRAVWERDGGQCTFVSEAGHRCEARRGLEYDHIEPFARGGEATVAGMRLRCRAHNQYEAERTFGAGFMDEKRQAAQRTAARRRAAAGAEAEEKARAEAAERQRADAEAKAHAAAAEAAEHARANDVIPWLRGLGFRAEESRAAAALCETIPDAPLEERVRVALSYFRRRRPTHHAHASTGGQGTRA